MNKELIDILTDIIEILERLCMSSNIKFAEDKVTIWDKTLLTYDKIKALEVENRVCELAIALKQEIEVNEDE